MAGPLPYSNLTRLAMASRSDPLPRRGKFSISTVQITTSDRPIDDPRPRRSPATENPKESLVESRDQDGYKMASISSLGAHPTKSVKIPRSSTG